MPPSHRNEASSSSSRVYLQTRTAKSTINLDEWRPEDGYPEDRTPKEFLPGDWHLSLVRCSIIEMAREPGKMILEADLSRSWMSTKKNSKYYWLKCTDVITQAGKEIEVFIQEKLGLWYPEIAFMGEESYVAGQKIRDDVPTFVVDPIDGASNLVHRLPDVCVSIGLVFGNRSIVGVVHNPVQGELWAAHRGGGAYFEKHGEPTRMLPLHRPPFEPDEGGSRLTRVCIGVDWGNDREGPDFELNLKVFTALARTQRTGGKQDMFWECGCWAWDVAAACCILREAGGVMVDGGM
ncbi:inositol monophosphatase [Apiospora aurea]|uniref:Inositol monophosphatase n=1 Tax=Apiospora aurea TaxID=335848 RepID=A0ABR1QZ22_9PEZI